MTRTGRITGRNRGRRNRSNSRGRSQRVPSIEDAPRGESSRAEPPRQEPQGEDLRSVEQEGTINWNTEFSNNDPRLGEGFPFERFLADFLEENRDKNCNFLLGIGTSGPSNPKEILQFIHNNHYENQPFFILLIDPSYRNLSTAHGRESSLRPFLDKEYSMGEPARTEENQYIKANHSNGNRVYLWNYEIPSAHKLTEFSDQIHQINNIKDDVNGPYEYGKHCGIETISENIQQFYLRLYTILRKPEFKTIYVYNCAYENSGSYHLDVDNTYYSGPRFTRERRLRILRSRGRFRFQYTTNQFFQYFCELLYILYKLNKPVYILENTRERSSNGNDILNKIRVYERERNNTAGGKRRRNHGTRKKMKLN